MSCDAVFMDGAYGAQRCTRVAGHRGQHRTTAAGRLAGLDPERAKRLRGGASLAETDESPTTAADCTRGGRTT